jgi:RepB DNA-primase from phage plasmid/CHC2 zinc finger
VRDHLVAAVMFVDQRAALRLQLAAIAGHESAGFFEVRHEAPGGGMRQLFHAVGNARTLVDVVMRVGQHADAYIGAAVRVRRSGGQDAIERVWCLWADCDGSRAGNRLELFEPRPSVVIRTGTETNVHGWWPLRSPLTVAQARRANRRLAHHLGADMRATDAARILRPAGTLNHKHEPAAPVRAIRVDLRVHDARDVVGQLADPPEETRSRTTVTTTAALPGTDPLKSIPTDVYVAGLTGRQVGRDGKAQCPFHGGGDERTPSLHAYADGSWFCFGCDAGGSIIDLGARLYGLEPRGRGFQEIRRRLAADLLGAVSAAP